jgi:uncharacterized protein
MPYFVLFYDIVEDFAAKRTPFRPEHLSLVHAAHERGDLVMAGALAEPMDGALLLFRGAEKSVAEEFARRDPYVTNGIVTKWRVRTWNVVTDKDAPTYMAPPR